MKKIGAFLLVFALIFTVTACGTTAGQDNKNSNTASVAGSSASNSSDVDSSNDNGSSALPPTTEIGGQNGGFEEEDFLTPEEEAALFVEERGQALLDEKAETFVTSLGLSCEKSIEAVGCGFVMTFKICEMEEVSDRQKKIQQAEYDKRQAEIDSMLFAYQEELSLIEYFQINICDKYGNVVAVLKAGNI